MSTDDGSTLLVAVNSTLPTVTLYNFTDSYDDNTTYSESDANFDFILYCVVMPLVFGVITLVGIVGKSFIH